MASYVKYECFTEDALNAVHNFGTDVIKVLLSNTAPDAAADEVKADAAEISAGNGYSAGGGASTVSLSRTGGTTKIIGTDVVITATGAVGPFRYAIIYNDTATGDPLIGYWDYGSSISLANGETFTVDFNPTNGIAQLT